MKSLGNCGHAVLLTKVLAVLLGGVALSSCGGGTSAVEAPLLTVTANDPTEDDTEGLVDYGQGPVHPPNNLPADHPMAMVAVESLPSFNGGSSAHTMGAFAPPFAFPVIAAHMVMSPDGRILAYGSNDKGQQTALLHYVLYDPDTASYPFLVLPNTTSTDLFCSTQTLLPDGRTMLAGGDRFANGVRNYATADVNIFDWRSGKLEKQAQSMAYQRWYGTSLVTGKGEHLVLGGRDDRLLEGVSTESFSTTPEIYTELAGWRTLEGADSVAAFGKARGNWRYPKAWVGPTGRIALLAHDGPIYQIETAGRGSIQPWPPSTGKLRLSLADQPAVMFQPGKILAAREGKTAQVIDINGTQPVITDTSPLHARRVWGSMTLLPDGRVWASGGSADGLNELTAPVYDSEIWSPITGTWTLAASAVKPRLYHGNAILLRDGRVLTAGGGAPGPVKGLNAEIYYPPYLFKKDGSGQLAARPIVTSLSTRSVTWTGQLNVQMATTGAIRRAVILRTGSATHSFNGNQRLTGVAMSQDGNNIQLTLPGSRNNSPPGFYILFLIDTQGVPSVGEIIKLS